MTAALRTFGTPAAVVIGAALMPFTSYEDVVRSYRAGLSRAGLRPCDARPECLVVDAANMPLARIGSRRTFAVGADGYTDYSRCLFDFGEDE